MVTRRGYADLPLHGGRVPSWLARRMQKLGGAIMEAIVEEYGPSEVLTRLSDPFWFQSLGCVMGMDWHSSGITTSVMSALKRSINPISSELGIYFCGGRGKSSLRTPQELLVVAEKTGLDGVGLVRSSKLSAKVDNTAVQDGFQLYLHCFVVTESGEWTVVQQGLNPQSGLARRYHWHSGGLSSFTEEPHSGVAGVNQGKILNLTHRQARNTRHKILKLAEEPVHYLSGQVRYLKMPRHHEVRSGDIDMKRLGAVLALAQDEGNNSTFEELLLTKGMGPRTLQSLTLISEVIHGTSSRFEDPARFSFALGGKDGHPFPVPTKVYDESIRVMRQSVDRAKIGQSEKKRAIKKLHSLSLTIEKNFKVQGKLATVIAEEKRTSPGYGGRTVKSKITSDRQLKFKF